MEAAKLCKAYKVEKLNYQRRVITNISEYQYSPHPQPKINPLAYND
ncbi:hypothetical protein Dfer_1424 [Dyadobacter fermentans DSM 18053]|uniref:Uncharacterized protein n=1 Tax=Dyadobacter fermentans (strain ATCC 700827 / DSM 18053 / CIP 107007 / KCTC 52180 / NS114) TaxID=471854 RepID=C6W762_DYAFD|nr:hypothetical protein Dfer_1424 [Dyadobacter fermentans DSM 18053]